MNGRDKRRRSKRKHQEPPLGISLVQSKGARFLSPATKDLARDPAPFWPDGEPHKQASEDYAPRPKGLQA